MNPIKSKFVINIEVTPNEEWSKAIDENGNRKGLARLNAQTVISEIKRRIEYYLEDQLDEDEAEIVYEVTNQNGIEDNYTKFTELVKDVNISWKS